MARVRDIIIISCTILPLVLGQCTKQGAEPLFRRSVYEFSIDLLTRLSEDNDGHFVASTLSPWALLAAISFGAADNTLQEIKQVLKLHPHPCFNNRYLELVKYVTSPDPSAVLERSASVFIDDSLNLKESFRNRLTSTGVSDITSISFKDFSIAAATINDYVRRATHGLVEEVVTAEDLEQAYFIMIDAMYFKGTWLTSFSTDDTEFSAFYDSHNNPIGDVNLMFVNSKFNITKIDVIKSTVLELPYGDSGRFSMLIILPDEGVTLNTVLDSMKKISLNSISRLFKREGPQTVSVQIPRFKISSDIDNLKELLVDMGLKDMFDSNRARFPDISDYELYVSSFIQKASVEVTEEGTVAAAATELTFNFRSSIQPMNFIANRPFLFIVADRLTEVPIFSGAYSKPSLY